MDPNDDFTATWGISEVISTTNEAIVDLVPGLGYALVANSQGEQNFSLVEPCAVTPSTFSFPSSTGGIDATIDVSCVAENLQIAINIKPGSTPNSINLCSGGAVPVTIWGMIEFDVANVDPDTLIFNSAKVKTVGKSSRALCSLEGTGSFDDQQFDSVGLPDGITDLTCHFVTQELTDLDDESTSATLSGAACDSAVSFPTCAPDDASTIEFSGEDSVNIVKTCE